MRMKKYLSSSVRQKLITQHRKERNGKVRDRIKAVLAYDEGYSYSEIARILLLDDETIRRHIEDYFSKHKLAPENGGSTSALDDKQTEELVGHLSEKTYLYVKDICAYVKRTYGIKYTESGMTKWLRSQDFRYKKPHGVPAKADREAQEKFIKDYRKTAKKADKKGEPVYFVDSFHPEHQTRLSYGWIRKGERKSLPTTARQYRLNFIGAISLEKHKIVHHQVDKVNTESIQIFLSKLRDNHPDGERIHLFLDNAGYHRSKEVRRYAKKLKIKFHYLPPYSPNLNPIERLWKIFHEKVTRNRYYEKFAEFVEAAQYFFRNIYKHKKILQNRINDNFQLLNSLNFAS